MDDGVEGEDGQNELHTNTLGIPVPWTFPSTLFWVAGLSHLDQWGRLELGKSPQLEQYPCLSSWAIIEMTRYIYYTYYITVRVLL